MAVSKDQTLESVLRMSGRLLNDISSFVIFALLDLLDFILFYVFKVLDFFIEFEMLSKLSSWSFVTSPLIEMLHLNTRRPKYMDLAKPRWSDCDCSTCTPTSWTYSNNGTLYVQDDGIQDNVQEAVVFIHGFISASAFWTETLYPNFSNSAKSKYRLLAFDLLGFGRSPKPKDSSYTLNEHLDMIERSILKAYNVKSFHIVAHSMGCILGMALAAKYADSIKSLTLIAPPYFPAPKHEEPAQYTMRRLAPRRLWPPMSFGASMACRYEHLSRTFCLLICKNHRIWVFLVELLTRNKVISSLLECLFLHTHKSAWRTLHNVILGSAVEMEVYMDRLKCPVTVFHGKDDQLIPVECSNNLQSRIPRANVIVIEKKDHLTIVIGRKEALARELEVIWGKPL